MKSMIDTIQEEQEKIKRALKKELVKLLQQDRALQSRILVDAGLAVNAGNLDSLFDVANWLINRPEKLLTGPVIEYADENIDLCRELGIPVQEPKKRIVW